MISFEANWIGVVVVTVIGMVVGFVWYAPRVMGNRWMAYVGTTEADLKARGGRVVALISNLIGSALTAYVIATHLQMIGITGIGEGIVLGLIVWIGFMFTTSWVGNVFEKRPIGLTVLNNLYYSITFMLMAIARTAIG